MDLPSLKSSRDSITITSFLLPVKVMSDYPSDFIEAFLFRWLIAIVVWLPYIVGI